jgi:cytochrome c oxidase subunit 2
MKKAVFFMVVFLGVGFVFDELSGMGVGPHHEIIEKEEGELVPSGELKNGVREIEVKAFQYGFSPDPIVVNRGERIRLKITSTDVTHGVLIKEYKINVPLPPKETKIIEFVADKGGEFLLHCSVYCGPGHGRMHGKLIVK